MSSGYEGERSIQGWSDHWRGLRLPCKPRLWVPSMWRFHRFFTRSLPPLKGLEILEVGCCPGRWMVYFHRYHGANVSGVEYAPKGCSLTRENLRLLDVPGNVFNGDIRDPTLSIGQFDLVYSLGVVEHYVDLSDILGAHLRLVRPGGYVLVTLPNYSGLHGDLLRRIDRQRYDEHVRYSLDELRLAAEALGIADTYVCSFGGLDPLMICGYRGRFAKLFAATLAYACAAIPATSPAVSAYLGLVGRRC